MVLMKSASITEFKARLSHYLRLVSRGSEVQIMQRGVPIARLVSYQASAGRSDKDRIERLVRGGILRRGKSSCSWLLAEPPISAPQARLSQALQEDREDRA
jgi:prevent-host-death family protein